MPKRFFLATTEVRIFGVQFYSEPEWSIMRDLSGFVVRTVR